MKKIKIIFIILFVGLSIFGSLFIAYISSKNNGYGIVSENTEFKENADEELNKNIVTLKDAEELDNYLELNPEDFNLGKEFNDFESVVKYAKEIYGYITVINFEKAINNAKIVGYFDIRDPKVKRYFRLINGKIVLYRISNAFYSIKVKKYDELSKLIFGTANEEVIKYLKKNGKIYRCVIRHAGHAEILFEDVMLIR